MKYFSFRIQVLLFKKKIYIVIFQQKNVFNQIKKSINSSKKVQIQKYKTNIIILVLESLNYHQYFAIICNGDLRICYATTSL